MPHGTTWFDLLFTDMQAWRLKLQDALGTSYANDADISIQFVVAFAFVGLLLIGLVLSVHPKISNIKKALIPDGRFTLRTFFEMMIEGTLSTMEKSMDRKPALFFLPLIGSCAFLIFFSNLLGLVPGFEPPTANLNTTLAMAIVIFFTTHIYGVKNNGIGYFAHFFGPIRKWYALPLMLLMFCIEFNLLLMIIISISAPFFLRI